MNEKVIIYNKTDFLNEIEAVGIAQATLDYMDTHNLQIDVGDARYFELDGVNVQVSQHKTTKSIYIYKGIVYESVKGIGKK